MDPAGSTLFLVFTSDIVVNSLKDFLAGFNPGPQPFNLVSTLTTSIVHFGAPI